MGAFAARMGDITAHGGVIVIGYPTVFIEGRPAARVSDMHVCPQVNPGPVPHVGGPILPPGAPTVLIGGLPAARVTDWAVCVGPIDVIQVGAFRTQIGLPTPPPPPPPSVSPPGLPGGGGGKPYVYFNQWVSVTDAATVVNAGITANVAVALVAAALGAEVVGVAVVVYPLVSKSYAFPPWIEPSEGLLNDEQKCEMCHENMFTEGVRDDAEMYFLR